MVDRVIGVVKPNRAEPPLITRPTGSQFCLAERIGPGLPVLRLAAKQVAFEQKAEHFKQKMRQHGPAAGVINQLIRGYLGHKELEVGTLDRGYQIRRNGKPVTGSLSEGEKTAIALCYFLSMLEAEGRQPKNLIVVVDDPISSLDMGLFIHGVETVKRETGATVLVIHHIGKNEKSGARGSSALMGAADTMIRCGGDMGLLEFKCAKQKDAEEFQKINWQCQGKLT